MSTSIKRLPPWAQGPFEIIHHANEHLNLAGDTDRRIALIGFDNSVEICIDVFLTLHPKARGGIEIPNEEVDKARRNFHTKLEFFYKYANDKKIAVEIPIEDLIWYHQLRNQLYHSGNGLVPEESALRGAQAAALLVFKTLFNVDVATTGASKEKSPIKVSDKMLSEWFGEKINNLLLASSKPRSDAQWIIETIHTKGDNLVMQSTNTPGLFYRVRELPDGRYGILVEELDSSNNVSKVITAYASHKYRSLDDVRNDLLRRGATEYLGEL